MSTEIAPTTGDFKDFPLDEAQREIVQASADRRMLVLAGAGSGKTHVLSARLARLLEDENVQPGHEILVLSFTRAVVREVRRRLAVTSHRSRLVRPVTFDSFATRLLASTPGLETWSDWQDQSYDGRIAAATSAISEREEARARISEYQHVFVDEIQDLVSVRASFVLEILKATTGGFTLLGDPAQGIYDFQLRECGGMTADELLEGVREIFAPQLRVRTLDHNYRARSAVALASADAGALLRRRPPEVEEAEERLTRILHDREPLGKVNQLPAALRGVKDPTALLCRTNAQALRISRELWSHGVEHRLQREATERALAPWIARALVGLKYPDIGQERFLRRVSALREETDTVPCDGEAWSLVSSAVGGAVDSLDVAQLAQQIREGRVPDELVEAVETPIVVSTVHRAKGLEFDNVIIVEPISPLDPDDETYAEETRVLYVALSRARDEIMKVQPPKTQQWFVCERTGDRWVKSPWGERWRTLGLEIRGDDLDHLHPGGTWLIDLSPQELQDYLATAVARGDPVTLERCHVRKTVDPLAFYEVAHEGCPIGVTSEEFAKLLARRIRPKGPDARWPRTITDVFVDGVDSVAGLPGQGAEHGLGVSDIWLRPRLVGLGRISWREE
jgi:hypothetical protein